MGRGKQGSKQFLRLRLTEARVEGLSFSEQEEDMYLNWRLTALTYNPALHHTCETLNSKLLTVSPTKHPQSGQGLEEGELRPFLRDIPKLQ